MELKSFTHFRRLLSSMTHWIPSMLQFVHVASPSADTWYRCITSHRTFLDRHARHAFAALLFTGLGFPSLSSPAETDPLFFVLESASADSDDWDSGVVCLLLPFSWWDMVAIAMAAIWNLVVGERTRV